MDDTFVDETFQPSYNDELDFAEDAEEQHWHSEAIHHMAQYFSGRQLHCGGPIPPKHLFSEKNIGLVRDCDFEKGIDACHNILDANIAKKDRERTLLKAIYDVKRGGVPKHLHAGMVLLHFKFCLGLPFPEGIYEYTKVDNTVAIIGHAEGS